MLAEPGLSALGVFGGCGVAITGDDGSLGFGGIGAPLDELGLDDAELEVEDDGVLDGAELGGVDELADALAEVDAAALWLLGACDVTDGLELDG